MEVDDSPPGGARPGTPLLGENSEPPSGPTTPTPLPRNSLKRRALFSPQKTPTAAPVPVSHLPQAPSICEQVSMVADDQLVLLNDWKLAMTSLAKALDLTVSSLQGRPRDLARGLAARFVSLAKQDSPQQIPLMTAVAPPQPSRQMEQPNQPPTPEACEGPLKRRTSQPTTWASLTAPRAGQGNWQTIAPEHRKVFLLSEKAASLAGDGYFEIPTEYHQVIIPRIPKQLWSLDGWIDTTITDISNEAERITGIKPLMAKLSKHPVERDSITAVIAFPKRLQHPLQLFGLSGLSRPTRPKQRPLQCTRCHRFHDIQACRSSKHCISCGSSKQEHNCSHSLPEPISPDITTIYTAGLTIINVYCPPNDPVAPAGAGSTPSTLSTLLGYAPPENTILAGDFNTRHPFWQPDTESHAITPGATGLLDWLDAHELELRLEPGTPTRGPNTLDLVFSNLPLRALVEDHLKTPSDHATIGIILEQEEPSPIYKLGSTNWEKARALASPPDPTLLIDLLAKQLVQISQLAIQGTSRYNTRRLPRTPWWTPELTDILHQTRQQQNPDYKQLWKAIIQHPDQLAAPPLNIQGAQVTTPQGKADAFLNHLLEKGALLPNQTEEGPPNKPLSSLHLPTKEHCWAALCAPPLSAPREDRLATTAWRELWPRDYTQLNAWRPISLLSTLGKGLERLLAQQIAVRAIQADVLAPCHFGALPGCSAIDLVQVLVHRVEEAFQQGKDASLLLLDVKGAFDAVIHQRLLSHLRLQGWHKGLLQLLKDWLTGRSVSVHIKEGTATAPIKGRLPQGSPLSPILFLLYAARIVSTLEGSFCYADDMGILLTGNTLEESSQQLVEAYKQITALGTETGLPFLIEKTEIQYFSRKQQQHLPTVTLPALYGSEVFYTGKRQKGVVNSLLSLFRTAALAIIPAYKTTPTAALLREADLPDPEALLNSILRRAAVRYMSLDTKHPIAQIAAETTAGRPKTRLKRILQLLLSPLPEHAIIELPLPPLCMLPTDNKDYSPAPLQISVYSDGSRTSQGAGYGYAVYFGPILVSTGHGPAGPRTEVYDAEIMGAVEGLRAALGQPCVGYSTQLVILLDNLAAASLLASYRPTPHRHGLSETFSQLAAQWMESPSILTMQRKPLQVRWIPGHSGIAGNELADKLAKLGSSIYSPDIPPSPAYL
ncbi:hypothetical protein AN2724.2 [Aspergillus nidulans FGSC A4]|uniref:Reverse transcriptase n=1 Tax=Emericella nidulans (strain FGSC A4 / ATCC 38163 / CBS 112.46 / NRRL 194 / M139) TaxID=227321 RepID=Q5B9Q6_EMENI|nr:hypothetical protein [Aspergillus nidulans FGSC A4]EAA63022.1 hypothetical protein AN2724.2 [Aspergillus nidulans FGSC A4]CBF84144.1 TPA: conserved hypothetical protein [Aspergillus nidulans FGSC A4]|eukprot:XP_660328.1 hypothetical protein AN2724.2 [Aspergillus nidulans FGSC A4]